MGNPENETGPESPENVQLLQGARNPRKEDDGKMVL